MATDGGSKRFDDPIVLDDGTTLTTLQQAVAYLAKTVPKAELNHEKVLIAADHLTKGSRAKLPNGLRPHGYPSGDPSERSARVQSKR